jgi:hypothetical protein
MSDEKAFMDVLASCNDACEAMDFSDDGWKPPVGTYDVAIETVTTGVKVKDGVTNVWIKPAFNIISDGEYQGRTFSEFMYIQPGAKELTPALRQLLRFATCLAGREIKNASEAAQIAQASVGEFLTLEVFTTVGKKGKSLGRTFTNIRYLTKLETTEVPAEAALAHAAAK